MANAAQIKPEGADMLLVSAVALIDRDGRLLLAQRPEGRPMAGLWEFPGGKVDAGETPPAALARELREELGVLISDSHFCPCGFAFETRDFSPPKPPRGIVLLLYTCRIWDGEPAPLEGGGLGWFRVGEIDSLDLAPLDRVLLGQLRTGFGG